MNTIDVNSVLAQIRALSAQSQGTAKVQAPAADQVAKAGGSFGTLIAKGIDSVNTQQQTASKLQDAFEMGDPSVDLATVMLASSKAQVSFRGMVEVRNRLVSAYQEVMNMPL